MMKIKALVLLGLLFSITAHARPGDDIWNNIRELYALSNVANRNIETLGNNIKNLQVQISTIPEGKQGERGVQGEKGEKGDRGTPGEKGSQGERGVQGEKGLQGERGLQGEMGLQGEQGLKGDKGDIGAQGPQGLPGTYTAGDGITIEGDVIKVTTQTHQVGEEYRGGLVFYVDESGQHGLIASKIDVNEEGIQWRNGASGNKVTNARGDGIGAGETNTRLIIAQQTIDNQNGVFAALQAANFQVLDDGATPCKTPIAAGSVCYGGWYLPSAFELQLLHRNLHQNNLSHFAPEFYWSSTEASVSNAWLINFSSGEITASNKSNTVGRVRAVSRF